MADNIEQRYGLDASQALAMLQQLDSAYAKHGANLDALASKMQAFNNSSGATSAAAKNVGAGFQSGMGQAVAATNQLTVSWGLMARIVTTQLVVRGLSELRTELKDAITSAVEFGTRVAEIGTIANGTLGSNSQIAAGIHKLSDEFGIAQDDLAKGTYQAISYGLKNPTEFLGDAANFAKASVTSMDASVHLLGGALNSFNLDTTHSAEVASKLFKVISIGAVRGEDLAANFNKVSQLGSEAGASLDELGAAFATITVKSGSAAQASTQIKGLFTALLKPTQEMGEAISQAGFASGQQAVQVLGLGGALKKLTTDSAGAVLPLDELEKRFGRIQGLLGVLAGVGSDEYIAKLHQISDAQEGLAKIKAGEILNSDAQVALRGWTVFKNYMTDEVGASLLHIAANNIKFFAPDDELKKAADKKLDEASAGAEAGYKVQVEQNNKKLANAQESVRKLNETYIDDLRNAKQENDSLVKDTEHTLAKIVTTRERYNNELGKQAEKAREIARDSAGRVQDLQLRQSDRTFNNQIADRSAPDQVAAKLTRAIAEANQASSQLEKAGRSGDQHQIGRAEALFNHAQAEAEAAASIAKGTKDLDLQAQAEGRLRQLTAEHISAEQTLQRLQDARSQKLEAEHTRQDKIVNSIRDQAAIVAKTSSVTDAKGNLLSDDKLAAQDKKRQAALAQIAKLGFSQKDLSIGDSLGLTKFLTEHQHDLTTKPQQLGVTVEGGIAKIKADITNAFKDFTIKLKVDGGVNFDALQKGAGHPLTNPAAVSSALADQVGKANESSFSEVAASKLSAKIISDLTVADANTKAARDSAAQTNPANYPASVDTLLNSIKNAITDAAKGGNVSSGQLEAIETMMRRVNETTQPGGGKRYPTSGELKFGGAESDTFNQLKQLRDLQQQAPQKVEVDPALLNNSTDSLTVLRKILKELEGGGGGGGGGAEAGGNGGGSAHANTGSDPQAAWQSLLDSTSQASDKATSGVFAPPGATVTAISGPGTSSGDSYSPFTAKANYLKDLAAQADRSNFDNYKDYHGLSTGGLVPSYLADGGNAWARGSDTVPAMLTPGEFVVNQKSAGRFNSQLQSINAGNDPSPVAGGDTIHNNIGDIHINGITDPKAVGAEVIRQINRTQRRGTDRIR